MTDLLRSRVQGSAPRRVDGPAKVTGTAPYANDQPVPSPAYAWLVQAEVARGVLTRVDVASALALDGVSLVLTPDNAPRLADTDDTDTDAELAALQSPEVSFRGQVVAVVVADSPETARHAASLVHVEIDQRPHDVHLDADRDDLYAPEQVNGGFETDTAQGDVPAALEQAAHVVDQTYTTAWYNNNPMEPHATTALWSDGELLLYESTQGVHTTREAVAKTLGLPLEQVHVVSPHVGGGFGAKGTPHVHTILAAMAARAVPGTPVKLALTRQQMFSLVGYRTPTIQRVRLGCAADGRLTAIAVDAVSQTSRIKEFAEQTAVPSRTMYAAPHRRSTHRLAALDVPVPSWMRAPGECPGMFGPEVALDELAVACGVDPVEFRVRNEPVVEPDSGKPFSSRNLIACLHEGARRFGWAGRDPSPGVREEAGWLVGTGVAASTYPVNVMPGSAATVRHTGAGRYRVEIGAADLGTGTWTALAQIAADALGVDFADVDLRIGDTALPKATVAGGSSGIGSWGSTVVAAARAFREKFGDHPADGDQTGAATPEPSAADEYAMHAFGAQFAEVRVHADTGEVRVPRLLGVFAVGRVVNPRLARSQLIGGMTMGLSMALHEQSLLDERFGHVLNHDFAEYHIATNSDVPDVEAHWVDEHDPHTNPMGTKGIGEIGIVGTAAAIVNAAYHATGVRVRDLPLTLDHFLR
ncbi:xanthine dehydrogenase family protein molybdopterin-binding subunit [Actinosynnema sp. NPDC047251]|uniref:Xanthine dehydrogenase molybdopterin binding subunit n=1 Tax=Saccharothrix espanaensis (strain ATCC 51144 / DSM 44229 / JCM 9112 / NBRC 15066 / NRRL 15764) TaxID=1179773 RepID=K0K6D4_SACES|nr:xanthine dehydrogenase family protein molybdopterin-binding subunit [Saccharothrix espanaensis]CCH32093.1 Xanthine dehydrogenase molybdopterin binding subunit [Saccharothrix espanaensis DSM 44229]